MNNFNWECRTQVEFGEGAVAKMLPTFVKRFAIPGKNILLGYGGGSIKKNGAYDDVIAALESIGYRQRNNEGGDSESVVGNGVPQSTHVDPNGEKFAGSDKADSPFVNTGTSCGARMNPETTCGARMNPETTGGAHTAPETTGGARMNPETTGGPRMAPETTGGPRMNPETTCGARMNPETTCGARMNPGTTGGPYIIEFSGIMSNPTVAKMLEGAELARKYDVGLILAVGGGSVMDCCEAISVQAPYDGDAWQDFWIDGKPMEHTAIPCGVVVTMPATGSEVNGCAVLTNEKTRIKCDRYYAQLHPLFAIEDPVYTLTMPIRQLRAGAFDIFTHIMEVYFSYPIEENPSDDVSEGLMRGLVRDFRAAIADPQDMHARSNLMWHASLAENNIIKKGKTLDFEAHNMEHQLSAYTNCNHGEGLAVITPVYYRHIYKDGLTKFVRFAKYVWELDRAAYDSDEAYALAGVEALADFIGEVGLPTTLRDLGFGEKELSMLPEIAESCFISQGAFRTLTHDEILEIYEECR